MTGIMVAVTERPLSILPGFPPMDGGQPEEKCASRKRSQQTSDLFSGKFRAQLESMFLRRVMIETRFEIQSFESAARPDSLRSDANCRMTDCSAAPTPTPLPSSMPTVPERIRKTGKASHVDRLSRQRPRLIDRIIGGRDRLLIRLQQRQTEERRPFEPTKRIRLIRPIQITKRRA